MNTVGCAEDLLFFTAVTPQREEECKAWWDLFLPCLGATVSKPTPTFFSGNFFLHMTQRCCHPFQRRHRHVFRPTAATGTNRIHFGKSHWRAPPIRDVTKLGSFQSARVEHRPWRCDDKWPTALGWYSNKTCLEQLSISGLFATNLHTYIISNTGNASNTKTKAWKCSLTQPIFWQLGIYWWLLCSEIMHMWPKCLLFLDTVLSHALWIWHKIPVNRHINPAWWCTL